jgi:hypothetical protein
MLSSGRREFTDVSGKYHLHRQGRKSANKEASKKQDGDAWLLFTSFFNLLFFRYVCELELHCVMPQEVLLVLSIVAVARFLNQTSELYS